MTPFCFGHLHWWGDCKMICRIYKMCWDETKELEKEPKK